MDRTASLRAVAPAIFVAAVVACAAPALADIIHLRDGGRVEGEVIEKNSAWVRVQARRGQVTLPAERVARIEPAPVSWKRYEQIKDTYPQTADGQYKLAAWCRDRDLDNLAERHFAAALKLDPNHGPTRAALGHARVGDVWLELDKKSAAANPAPDRMVDPQDPQAIEAARAAMQQAEREMVDMIQAEWFRRVRAIRVRYLQSAGKSRFNTGAEMLLNIRDPLAVEPMMQQLASGGADQRKLLVRVLARFHTSSATLGLLEAALLDDDGEIRKLARRELDRRSDPRILAHLLKALDSEEEDVVRNAADAIGYLGYVEAVPHLAKALTEKETRRVRTETVVRTMRRAFVDADGQLRTMTIRRKRSDPFHPAYRKVTVTLFRTEVQEALMAVAHRETQQTVNYGFDAQAWMDWYRRNVVRPKRVAPAAPAGGPPPVPPAGNPDPANP